MCLGNERGYTNTMRSLKGSPEYSVRQDCGRINCVEFLFNELTILLRFICTFKRLHIYDKNYMTILLFLCEFFIQTVIYLSFPPVFTSFLHHLLCIIFNYDDSRLTYLEQCIFLNCFLQNLSLFMKLLSKIDVV